MARVGDDRRVREALLVERAADRAHAPVHHVAGRDHVGPGAGLGDGGAGQQLDARSRCPRGRRRAARPQWPWSVYSHRHTSVITSRSGWASLIARVASCTTPSSSQAPEPSSSLSAGMPNSSTAGMPSARRSPASCDGVPDASGARRPASRRSARGPARRARTAAGPTGAGLSSVSRTRSRRTRRLAQPAQPGLGERHGFKYLRDCERLPEAPQRDAAPGGRTPRSDQRAARWASGPADPGIGRR